MKDIEYSRYIFKAKIWKYQGKGGWFFVTIPKTLAKKIRAVHHVSEEGWGRLKTTATIKNSSWSTSIWFDSKFGSYLLPVKSQVRKSQALSEGSLVEVELSLSLDKAFSKWLLR